MIRLIRWLVGCVEFEFSSGFVEGFLTDLYDTQISAFDISVTRDRLVAKCPAGDYMRLHSIAHKHGGRLRIIKRFGAIFHILKLRARIGIAVGMLLAVLIFCFLSGFVWDVQVVGNERIISDEVLSLLNENGFDKGVLWSRVDKDYYESLLLSHFDDMAWVHINRDGALARVEISETIPKPAMDNREGIYNVVASDDGVIVSIVASDGWEVVRAGEAVVKGDLLISGMHQTDKKNNTAFAHARGVVIAQRELPFELNVSREQRRKRFLKQKNIKSLYIFGLKIPLCPNFDKSKRYEYAQSAQYLRLNDKDLPLGVIDGEYSYYERYTYRLSDRELTSLINEEIDRALAEKYGKENVVKKDIAVSLNEGNAVAKGSVIITQDIAQEQKLKKK